MKKFNLKTGQKQMENAEYENVQEVFTIPVEIFAFFQEKVEKLNKRALKNNIPGIQYEVLEQKVIPENPEKGRDNDQAVYKIKVVGVVPRVDGWSFVATISHVIDDYGQYTNIVSAIPSLEDDIPSKYWKQEPICEHCKTRRRIKDTFILRNEDGKYKQCSRNCLADFLRNGNAEDIIRAAEILAMNQELSFLTEGDYDEFGGIGRKKELPLLNILALTNKVVSQLGYVKSSDYEHGPTKETIFQIIDNKKNNFKELLNDLGLQSVRTDAKDYIIADEAVQWVKDLTEKEMENSPYLRNLKSVVSSPFFGRKFMGIVISIIPSYLRVKDKTLREETLKRVREENGDGSPYLGNIGDSIQFNVLIEKTKGPFRNGESMLYVGVTEDFKMVKWWGKPSDLFEEEQKYAVIGVPISHKLDGYEKTEMTELRDVILESDAQSYDEEDPFIGEFVNEKGKMDDFILTLIDHKGPFESQYRYGYNSSQSYMIYIFQDDMGRKAKWSGPSGKYDFEIGGKYKVRAKPKKHDQYDRYENGPVTILTNVRNVKELEGSPEVEKENKDRVQKIIEAPIPEGIDNLFNLLENAYRVKEIVFGRYPDLNTLINKKITEIKQVMESMAYRDFLESEDAVILFKAYVWNNLGREPTDIENRYLKAVERLYMDENRVADIEKKCNLMQSNDNLLEQNRKLCQFFYVLAQSARQFVSEAVELYNKEYKEKYMEMYNEKLV